MMPIMVMTLMLPLVMSRASVTPMKLSGSANMIESGWTKDPNSDAKIK